MKKYLAIATLAIMVLIFSGCGEVQDNTAEQAKEKEIKKTKTTDNEITIPGNASKECKKEYTEKIDGKYVNCADYGTETACVYYKKKSTGKNHRIEQINECQACMNWGRPEILDKDLEFLGIAKGKCL